MADILQREPPPHLSGEGEGNVAAIVRPYGVGIDCHSKFIAVCVLRQCGLEIRRYESEFSSAWPELEKARMWVLRTIASELDAERAAFMATVDSAFPIQALDPRAFSRPGAAEVADGNADSSTCLPCAAAAAGVCASLGFRYVIESTACYHFPVIHAFGGKPCIVNPMLAGPYRRKTDKLDARTLAYHGISGLWPESFWVSLEKIEFRALVLGRRQTVRERTRHVHAINNLILRWGHTVGAYGGVIDSENRSRIEDLCRGTLIPGSPYFSPHALPETISQRVLQLFRRYDELTQQLKVAEKTLLRRCAEMTWETADAVMPGDSMLAILTSIPGVGNITAATWLAEVVTPRRFASPAQVAAYVGCDPSVKVSAGKVTSHTRRKGNTQIHQALVQVAQMLVSHRREAFGEWGYRLSCKHAKGGWQKAIAAVARRIGLCLYHVQRTGTFFDPTLYPLGLATGDVPDGPVAALGFSPRVLKLLESQGIATARALVTAIDGSLFKTRGLGPVSRKEIVAWHEQQRVQAAKRSKGPKPAAVSTSAGESSPAQSAASQRKTGNRKRRASRTESSAASTCSSSTTGAKSDSRSARPSKTSRSTRAPSKGNRARKSG